MITHVFQLLPPELFHLLSYLPQAEAIEDTVVIFFVVRRLLGVYRRELAIERRLAVSVRV